MGSGTDKLFIKVCGHPIICHTWRLFDSCPGINEIILVIRPEMERDFVEMTQHYNFLTPYKFVAGGKQRQESVWNGLQAASPQSEIVAIHDGARPCTSRSLIEAAISAAREHGAAVAAQPVSDTIKASADGQFIGQHLDRSQLWSVQTPQVFKISVIRRALELVHHQGLTVTDDTAACELIGHKVKLVIDQTPNPKATVPADLTYIEMLLQGSVAHSL